MSENNSKLDLTKPNAKAVSEMDSYFQFNGQEREADRIGGKYFKDGDGWEDQDEYSIRNAWTEFINLMERTGTTAETIIKENML